MRIRINHVIESQSYGISTIFMKMRCPKREGQCEVIERFSFAMRLPRGYARRHAMGYEG